MTQSMSRWALAGLLAVAAISAASVFDVGMPAADAAPSVSPFAGTYGWGGWPTPITISDGGSIKSSYSNPGGYKGSIGGRVGDDGSYSFTRTQSYFEHGARDHGWHTSSYTSSGTLVLDADGNIVGTPISGASFTWIRQ